MKMSNMFYLKSAPSYTNYTPFNFRTVSLKEKNNESSINHISIEQELILDEDRFKIFHRKQ